MRGDRAQGVILTGWRLELDGERLIVNKDAHAPALETSVGKRELADQSLERRTAYLDGSRVQRTLL